MVLVGKLRSTFNIPVKVDEWLYIQFVIFFLIGFCINAFSNGQATLIFFEDYYSVIPNSDDLGFQTERDKVIQEYSNQTYFNSRLAFWVAHFLYWILSPAVNFYFAIFRFKKGTIWN